MFPRNSIYLQYMPTLAHAHYVNRQTAEYLLVNSILTQSKPVPIAIEVDTFIAWCIENSVRLDVFRSSTRTYTTANRLDLIRAMKNVGGKNE